MRMQVVLEPEPSAGEGAGNMAEHHMMPVEAAHANEAGRGMGRGAPGGRGRGAGGRAGRITLSELTAFFESHNMMDARARAEQLEAVIFNGEESPP